MYRVLQTSMRNGATSVGATTTDVLPENPYRVRAILVNDSDTVIYLFKGGGAAVNQGIRINANGGSYEEVPDSLGRIYRGCYTAINSVGAKVLTWCEENVST